MILPEKMSLRVIVFKKKKKDLSKGMSQGRHDDKKFQSQVPKFYLNRKKKGKKIEYNHV